MPTPPHAVDGTDTANIGTRKRKPVHDPLNSEVERLAALTVKKKARLDQNNFVSWVLPQILPETYLYAGAVLLG